jgi:hypothetical protein
MSNLRILYPSELSIAPGGADANFRHGAIANAAAAVSNSTLLGNSGAEAAQ